MESKPVILAADVGGTNARFARLSQAPRADSSAGAWAVEGFKKVAVADYPTFANALQAYLDETSAQVTHLAICAAGVVTDQVVKLTNADWTITAQTLIADYNLMDCMIVNDFAAMTRSVPELADADFDLIKTGTPRPLRPTLVCGPGTGFGAGYLVPTRNGYHVLATEGGHLAYAPLTDAEMEMTKIMRVKTGYVSAEQVSSGSGLNAVHEAICQMHGTQYAPLHPKIIAERAHEGDVVCAMVCEIRASATMSAAGSLVLTGGAQGGCVLAGGVSERMIDFFKTPSALARFTNRGPRKTYMNDVPVRLLHNPNAPLIGAAALLSDRGC